MKLHEPLLERQGPDPLARGSLLCIQTNSSLRERNTQTTSL